MIIGNIFFQIMYIQDFSSILNKELISSILKGFVITPFAPYSSIISKASCLGIAVNK